MRESTLEALKQAIASQKGFGRPGTVATRLHNPGALLFAEQPGAEPHPIEGRDGDVREYAEFSDDASGWRALEARIRKDAARGLTLQEYIRKCSVAADDSYPAFVGYLAFVMCQIGARDPQVKLTFL